jgi:hypothetical protein
MYMDDEYIDETGTKPMPEGYIPQLAPALHLAMLTRIKCSANEKLFSVARGRSHREQYVDAVLALEKELQEWKDRAPSYINSNSLILRPNRQCLTLMSPPNNLVFGLLMPDWLLCY